MQELKNMFIKLALEEMIDNEITFFIDENIRTFRDFFIFIRGYFDQMSFELKDKLFIEAFIENMKNSDLQKMIFKENNHDYIMSYLNEIGDINLIITYKKYLKNENVKFFILAFSLLSFMFFSLMMIDRNIISKK